MNNKQLKRDRTIYWTTTGIIGAVMTYSIISFTFFENTLYPDGAFNHLHLPPWFKVELTIAKVLGVLAILLPGIPGLIREFAYAGFAITLASAAVAHSAVGDRWYNIIDPLLFLGILIVSYIYYARIKGYTHGSRSNIEMILSK